MTDRVKGYAAGLFEIARAEDQLDRVQSELLQIAAAFRSSDELRDSLSNPQLPTDRKKSIVDGLLETRASDLTVAFVNFAVGMGRASSLPDIVDEMVETAAASVNREVAEIRTAVELDAATVERLIAALARKTGKQLEPKVIVDPSVIGGIVARVGDTVIDGSVQKRLSGLREALKAR
ncbi:MAG: ATP synthase F1 subunit delta [Acidimicrobiia bacterium]|nr:ATP synthase F1 subunit delta [Acidimicrobiia bacterium]MDH3398277.1 ATP synthase F1 subunit delta [Acidimicrobiia bacterium]